MLSVDWRLKRFSMTSRFYLGSVSFALHNQIKIFTSIHFMLTYTFMLKVAQLNTERQLEVDKKSDGDERICSEIIVMVISTRRTVLSMGRCVHCIF